MVSRIIHPESGQSQKARKPGTREQGWAKATPGFVFMCSSDAYSPIFPLTSMFIGINVYEEWSLFCGELVLMKAGVC